MSTATAPPPAPTINPKLIAPFVQSVRAVFSKMVGVETTVERPYLKPHPAPSYDVSGVIGFSGQITGSVVVSFQREAAIKLVAAFAGSPMEPGSPDFTDAIGEIANMVAGSAKKDLGVVANITVPSVVIGPSHTLAGMSGIPCVVIPVTTPVGKFAVEVSIKQTDETKKQA